MEVNTIEGRKTFIDDILGGRIEIYDVGNDLFERPCSITETLENLKQCSHMEIGSGKSGTVCKICMDSDCDYKFALKKSQYRTIFQDGREVDFRYPYRPENVEVAIFKLLNRLLLNGLTPHIPFYMGDFICYEPDIGYSRSIIMEWADGDLHKLLNNIPDKYSEEPMVFYKNIIFQILAALAVIQKYVPNFRHNDLHTKNILYFETPGVGYYKYMIGDMEFTVPDMGFQLALWDFDFSSVAGEIDNMNVFNYLMLGITEERNHYIDMYKVFNSMLIYGNVRDRTTKRFIQRSTPMKRSITNSYGNLIKGIEPTNPMKVLEDPYFDDYRYVDPDLEYIETYGKPTYLGFVGYRNEQLFQEECPIYGNLPYYTYRDTTHSNFRNGCYATWDFDELFVETDFLEEYMEDHQVSINTIISEKSLDYRDIQPILYDLLLNFVQSVYVPESTFRTVFLVAFEKAVYYIYRKHVIDIENYSNPFEIADTMIQFEQFVVSEGIEERYLI